MQTLHPPNAIFARQASSIWALAVVVLLAIGVGAITPAVAADGAAADDVTPQVWAIHGQATNVTQGHAHFRSPYSGTNSLIATGRTEETTDLTLYAGIRLGPATEF
jgi:high affinity Mn2+ porin